MNPLKRTVTIEHANIIKRHTRANLENIKKGRHSGKRRAHSNTNVAGLPFVQQASRVGHRHCPTAPRRVPPLRGTPRWKINCEHKSGAKPLTSTIPDQPIARKVPGRSDSRPDEAVRVRQPDGRAQGIQSRGIGMGKALTETSSCSTWRFIELGQIAGRRGGRHAKEVHRQFQIRRSTYRVAASRCADRMYEFLDAIS